MLAKIRSFLTEVTVELRKVSWPGRDELVGSTIVVIIGVIILSIFIGICDYIFSVAVHLIIK